ncbi:MAG: hypothetical protein HY891_08865 [Deltaproteobacteria bacterium]|nr:hypothetical protein [Deltaproteobacteria bacterium]
MLTIDWVLPDGNTLGKTYTFYQDFNVVTKGSGESSSSSSLRRRPWM